MTVVLAGLFVIAGCEITDPTEGVTLFLDYEAGATYVNGKIIDANSGEAVSDQDVTVTIGGPDAGQVRGVEGARKNVFSPEFGVLSFVLQDKASADDPVDIRVQVEADGYLTTAKPLKVIEENASFEVQIVPMSAGSQPEGVSVAENQDGATDDEGRIVEDVTVEADDGESSTSIMLKKDTRLMDVDGNELSGRLSTTVVNFKGTSQKAQESFPCGFLGLTVQGQGPDGSKRPNAETSGTFMTAGYTAIEITDEEGRQARNFDRPVEVRMNIPADTKHPEEGGRPVEEGDVIPVYSFETDSGAWTYEGRDTVEVDSNTGKLFVDYETTHLSYFNLDWFNQDYCQVSQPVSFTGMRQGYRWVLRRQADDRFLSSGTVPAGVDEPLLFYNAPGQMPVTLQILKNGQEVQESSKKVNDLCSEPTTVNLPTSSEPLVTLTAEVKLTCASDGRGAEVRPSYPLHIREVMVSGGDRGLSNISGFPNGEGYTTYTMRKGALVIPELKESAYYQTTVYYEGEEYSRVFNIGQDKDMTSIEVDGQTIRLDDYGVSIDQVNESEYAITMDYDIAEGEESGGFCE